jgi:hypothetical protein
MIKSDYYYIPLCNKDFTFENIFSSESISPNIFYEKRNFGITHFYQIPTFHNKQLILLFSSIPQFNINAAGAIKFVLAIKRSEIESNDIIFITEGVIAIAKTIYLQKNNFKLLFFTEKELKIVVAKSELSHPTKPVKKYQDNFLVVNENESTEFGINLFGDIQLGNNDIENEINSDRKFNTIKGFIYGLITEIAFEKSPEEIKIKRSIQTLINAHAELKNKIELSNRQTESRYSRAGNLPLKSFLSNVLGTLKELETHVYLVFPKKELTISEIANMLFTQKPDLFLSIEESIIYVKQKYFDSLFLNTEHYSQLKKKVLSLNSKEDTSSLLENLNEYFNATFSSSGNYLANKNASRFDENTFKELVFKLENLVTKYYSSNRKYRNINLKDIVYNSISNEITLLSDFGYGLTETDKKEYILLSNVILRFSKLKKGDAGKEEILELVKEGAQAQNKSVVATNTLLYKYLNNEIPVYSLEKVISNVMRNFVAFIFNSDSIEKLERYLEANNLKYKWMAYSFWCGFNGFANTGSNFLKPIFEANATEIQNQLDSYLLEIRELLGNNLLEQRLPKEINLPPEQKKEDQQATDFFEKFIKNKFNLTSENFLGVIALKKDTEKLKILKSTHGIEASDAKHILNSFKKFIKSPELF